MTNREEALLVESMSHTFENEKKTPENGDFPKMLACLLRVKLLLNIGVFKCSKWIFLYT